MKFDVLYWDPPWEFTNKKTGGSHKSGAVQKYPTMPLPSIQQIPVASIANPNAALFLWVPSRLKFSHGQPTALAWGFPHHKATIYWHKIYRGNRMGMGFWYRGEVEELLVYTRGDVEPFGCQRPNYLSLPVGEHSEKPEEFRRLIEDSTGKFNRRQCMEGFARKKVSGWTGLGSHITGRDVRQDVHLLAGLHIDAVPAWPEVQHQVFCDWCDGTGSTEGGKVLLTQCDRCGGTGQVWQALPNRRGN